MFRRWPSSSTAAALHGTAGKHALHRTAGKQWAEYKVEVMDTLAASPSDAVLFALLTLKDASLAWELAQSLALDDDRSWSELIKAYEKIDPIATLPIHRRLVERELVEAGAQHYRRAARRLAKMRTLAAGTTSSTEVDDFVADLREAHRRRPRLQQEFDRANLPWTVGPPSRLPRRGSRCTASAYRPGLRRCWHDAGAHA